MSDIKNKIKVGDIVKVNYDGKIGIISAIQVERNRYQLRDVSGWQYVTDDLTKVDPDSLITTIESQKEEIEKLKTDRNEWADRAESALLLLEVMMLKNPNQKEGESK